MSLYGGAASRKRLSFRSDDGGLGGNLVGSGRIDGGLCLSNIRGFCGSGSVQGCAQLASQENSRRGADPPHNRAYIFHSRGKCISIAGECIDYF